jgi:hypothetical protein
MRFRTQQIGLALVGFALQGYLIWQWKAFEAESVRQGLEASPVIQALVGWIYAFVAFRGIAWALWSPARSRFALDQFGLTISNVVQGRFRGFLQWFLNLDKEGRGRDA